MVERFERFSLAILEITQHWHKLTADETECVDGVTIRHKEF